MDKRHKKLVQNLLGYVISAILGGTAVYHLGSEYMMTAWRLENQNHLTENKYILSLALKDQQEEIIQYTVKSVTNALAMEAIVSKDSQSIRFDLAYLDTLLAARPDLRDSINVVLRDKPVPPEEE